MLKVYFYVTSAKVNNFGLTTDLEEAQRLGTQEYGLATLQDLSSWLCATGEIFKDEVVEVEEGAFQWMTYAIDDPFNTNETESDYIMLWDRLALQQDEELANAPWQEELAAAYEDAGFYTEE